MRSSNDGRSQLAHDLLGALVAYTQGRPRDLRAPAAAQAARRCRRRGRLSHGGAARRRAAHARRARRGRRPRRTSANAARRPERVDLCGAARLRGRELPRLAGVRQRSGDGSAASAFPPLDEDRQTVAAVMPAWMGIQFRPRRRRRTRSEKSPARSGHRHGRLSRLRRGQRRPRGRRRRSSVRPDAPFTEPQQVREWTMRREIGEPAPLDGRCAAASHADHARTRSPIR